MDRDPVHDGCEREPHILPAGARVGALHRPVPQLPRRGDDELPVAL